MKSFKLFIYCILTVFLLFGCSKDESKSILTESNDSNAAKLKVIYASAYVIRDSIHIKINDERISNTFLGNSTTNLTTPFPGGGLNTGGDSRPFYLSVRAGETKVFIAVPKKNTSIDSIIRFSGQARLEAGKYYSAYITDTLANASMVLVEENMSQVTSGTSRFKFVNLIPNIPAVDVYFDTVLVAANVNYKAVSPEFVLPYLSIGKWRIREAGALPTATPIAFYPALTGVYTIPNERSMTVFAKGYKGGTLARTPTIGLLFNK